MGDGVTANGTRAGRGGRGLHLVEADKAISTAKRADTIAGRLSLYREALIRKGFSDKTVRTYCQEVWRAEWWCEQQGYTLRTVPPIVFGEFVERRPKSRASRQHLRSAVRHYWDAFKRKNAPLWMVRVPRKPKMVCRALTEEEATLLAAVARARGDKRGLAVLLGMYQALRREEISQVAWQDFTGDGRLKVYGKGDKPASIPLHPVVAEAVATSARDDPVWVFPGQTKGRPITPTSIWSWIRSVAAEVGIEHVTPHRLRHTCLAVANDNTGDLRAVQDFARHSDIDTTAGYTRTTERRLQAVVAAVEYGGEVAVGLELPAVPYGAVICALVGRRHVDAWLELGELLTGRGWTFELDSGGVPLWRPGERADVFVTALHPAEGAARFEVFRLERDDEASVWELSSALGAAELGEALAAGATVDAPPTTHLGPWIEGDWLAAVSTEATTEHAPC